MYSTVLPCVKCWYSHWGQAFTPPHLSANASPSVPLVRDEHRTDILRPLPGILWVCFRNVNPSLLLTHRADIPDLYSSRCPQCRRPHLHVSKMQIRTFTGALWGLIRFRACPECSGYQVRRQQDSHAYKMELEVFLKSSAAASVTSEGVANRRWELCCCWDAPPVAGSCVERSCSQRIESNLIL